MSKFANKDADQNQDMRNYYKFQSKIYDLTRWTFLFGRKGVLRHLPFDRDAKLKILEVGCGTGFNLRNLCKLFPNAECTGMDVSEDMIQLSRKNTAAFQDRVSLIQKPYSEENSDFENSFDLVLFSYSLTMINPQWKSLILLAKRDLKKDGIIAVADFHDSKRKWFKNHMSNHHVRMDSHLVPLLEQEFNTLYSKAVNAYLGVWQYMIYVGKKG